MNPRSKSLTLNPDYGSRTIGNPLMPRMAGDMARRQLRRMFPLVQLLMFSQAFPFVSQPTPHKENVVHHPAAQDLALPENVISTLYGFLGVIVTTLFVNIVSWQYQGQWCNTAIRALKTDVQDLNKKVEGLRDKVDGLKEQMVSKGDHEQKVDGLKAQIVTKTEVALFVVFAGIAMLMLNSVSITVNA